VKDVGGWGGVHLQPGTHIFLHTPKNTGVSHAFPLQCWLLLYMKIRKTLFTFLLYQVVPGCTPGDTNTRQKKKHHHHPRFLSSFMAMSFPTHFSNECWYRATSANREFNTLKKISFVIVLFIFFFLSFFATATYHSDSWFLISPAPNVPALVYSSIWTPLFFVQLGHF